MDNNERSFEEQKLLYYTALMVKPPIIDLHRLIEERCARAIEDNLEAVMELNKKVLEILMIPAAIHSETGNALDNGWISVNDRLPEVNCDVLVVKQNGKVYQMSYHAPFDKGKRLFQWWGFGQWIDQHSQVTHWMNMPCPPGACHLVTNS